MLYTIGEIIAFILVAALLGGAIGWLARGLSVRSRIEERLEREVAGRQLRINSLEDDLRDAQAGEARAKEKVKSVNRQLDEQRDLTLTLEARLGEAESASEQMALRLAARTGDDDGALTELEEALAASKSDLSDATAEAERVGAELADRDAELRELRSELERTIAEAEDSAEALAQDDGSANAELEELRGMHAELEEQHRAHVESAEGLRSELATRVRQIDDLEAELEELRARSSNEQELEALRSEVASLRAEPSIDVEALHVRIKELEADLADRDSLLEELTDPQPSTPLEAVSAEEGSASLSSVVDDALADHVGDEHEQGDVDSDNDADPDVGEDSRAAQVPDADGEGDAVEAAGVEVDGPDDPAPEESVSDDPAPELADGDDALTERSEAEDPIVAIARRTGGDGPAVHDDLQAIKGIGGVLEGLLYSMGITSYRQIAQFTDDDIDVLNTRMGRFKDRMRRDAWMSQAADLHESTHGTDV